MPHTNSWSDNTPLGSDAADTMDNNMRRLRLDVAERMNDILGADNWRTQDPITLPGMITGLKFAKRYFYDDTQAPASKAQNPENLKAVVIFRFTGTTNSGSQIQIRFGALFETYDMASLDTSSFVRGILQNTTVNDIVFLLSSAIVGDTITYMVKKSNGNVYSNDAVQGHIIFWASAKPT